MNDHGSVPELDAAEIARMMERARAAAGIWGGFSPARRRSGLARLRHELAARTEALTTELGRSLGKTAGEALVSDILSTLDMLKWNECNARRVLAPDSRPTPRHIPRTRSFVSYHPLGVVAVIAPWNFPVQLSLGPASSALAAGNAVIIKPSEYAHSVADMLQDICARALPVPHLVQTAMGGPETGRHLSAAGPDMIFFTGSTAAGKAVMSAAALTLTPVILELGGKDAMIVCADCDLDRAVNGALYGAFMNAGQACVSTERIFVQRPIYERFCAALAQKAAALRTGIGSSGDIGALSVSAQADIVEDQVRDALARGARLLNPFQREGSAVRPIVIADVTAEMKLMREETFGPVAPVMAFDTDDEAVRLANDSIFGLGASVWTADTARGQAIAARMTVGSCSINDAMRALTNPALPFGGVKHSGMGRYRGPEGLRAFSRVCAVTVNKGREKSEPHWFPYSDMLTAATRAAITAFFGGGHLLDRWKAMAGTRYFLSRRNT